MLPAMGTLLLLLIAELTFAPPKSWKESTPTSMMRKAQYAVGDAEVIIYYFGLDQGGTAEQNIERWKSQFTGGPAPSVEKKKIGGLDTTVLDIRGTYTVPEFMQNKGDKPEAKKGWRMIAAVFETKEGRYFVRLIGPEKTVEGAKKDFDAFLASAKVR
jgi:hypothetical protein